MANQITTTVVQENDFVWCHYVHEADTLAGAPTDVTNQILIDASTMTTGITATKLAVVRVLVLVTGTVNDMRIQFYSNGTHTGDTPIFRSSMGLSNSAELTFPGDGLQGPTIAGLVGDITVTTTGLSSAGEALQITIEARKIQ